MPSLQQVRYEALAAEVERATQPFGGLGSRFVGPYTEPIEACVERVDGSLVGFKLREVVLDGGMLVGRDAARQPVAISLADVKALWRRRFHPRNTATVCAATMVATAAVLAVASSAPIGAIIFGGAVFGLPLGGGICVVLNRFKVLSEWALLYDKDR